jgi:alkyldihydroxyacetonephosphate synthase
METRPHVKPVGWGDPHITFEPLALEEVRLFIQERFALTQIPAPTLPVPLPTNAAASSSAALAELKKQCSTLLGATGYKDSPGELYEYAGGKSYLDVLEKRQGQTTLPAAVLLPQNLRQLQSILQLCQQLQIAVVPFAGGTSVVGGVKPLKGNNHACCVALDLTPLNNIGPLDPVSRTVRVQAGVYGKALEAYLNAQGFTLGHFPQSFEYSTVGGWLAARSSGQNSLLYGHIAAMVQNLVLVAPVGTLETQNVPNQACGPELDPYLLGSEGTLGILAEATLRISPLPQVKEYRALLFQDFAAAAHAARLLVQSEVKAAMIRVADAEETDISLRLGMAQSHGLKRWLRQTMLQWWSQSGYRAQKMCLLMLGLEGSAKTVAWNRNCVRQVLRSCTYKDLGTKPGNKWLKDRFLLPYARDNFLDHSFLAETLETATTWTQWQKLYHGVRNAILLAAQEGGHTASVQCHMSHLYPTGTSLYFTVLAPQVGDPVQQWQRIKKAANLAIQTNGGVISHHHGVGADHRDYLLKNPLEKQIWLAVKQTLDPAGIMNPGKIF